MTSDPKNSASRAVVVGLGLIGTSVAFALRHAGWTVTGRDLDPLRAARAKELGAIDAIGDDPLAMIAFVAVPVATIAEVAAELFAAPHRADLIVTDVGGVKGPLAKAGLGRRFVGGHPMAGSEQEGPDGATPDLFVGATWVLTPTEETDDDAFGVVRTLVTHFGAEVVALSPERHDALVAVVSHVPHLTAANLMVLAADATEEHQALLRLAAGGFRDMTRIAAGDPTIWPDIFRDNAAAVLAVLDDLLERLITARDMIALSDRAGLVRMLEQAKAARRNLPPRIAEPETLIEFRVPIADRDGAIAEVTTALGGKGINIFDIEIAHSAEGLQGVLVLVIERSDVLSATTVLSGLGFRPIAGKPI